MPGKRGLWSEESLQAAMTAVKYGHMTGLAAARSYKIPRTTLYSHIKSGSDVKRIGRKSTFTQEQENDFVIGIFRIAKRGKKVTPSLIRKEAFLFCEKNNIEHSFNKKNRIAGPD
ncbi:uncharacterized protein LOC114362921 [Ostrinia furnacalis]|uniref:uncharacterized protein LOC114362921 n=1 Tax=Ostrinia furnacalis TaxID=93504 RepID=UPI00103946E3|nr:uncharacterized protein LOC114362921 [Ostrinia furnacalis]